MIVGVDISQSLWMCLWWKKDSLLLTLSDKLIPTMKIKMKSMCFNLKTPDNLKPLLPFMPKNKEKNY